MNSSDTVLALDQSTSATKAVLFDSQGKSVAEATRNHGSTYPQPGWVEQDPDELGRNTLDVLAEAAAGFAQSHQIRAIGLTNQRETIVVWNRKTGRPLYPALGWQCLRGSEITSRWRSEGLAGLVLETTGLPLDPHFSAPKIAWILQSVPGARQAADRGQLAFGTVDSWLINLLTEGRVHATDPSNASRTLLYNLKTGTWDEQLLTRFGIPRSMAPEIRMSDADFGTTTLGGRLDSPLPLRSVMGDSHAALFGLKCFEPGQAKATFGTGSSVMMNLGPQLPEGVNGKVATSVAWGVEEKVSFVLEGNIHHSGDTLRWLVEDLQLFRNLDEWEALANATPGTGGTYLVPAFSGLGAPYWDEAARGALVGLVRGTTKAQVARAGLESLAYQVVDLLEAMRKVSGRGLDRLAVDGGPTKNPVLMQLQSDLGQVAVEVTGTTNASVFGAACLAGMATGLWPDLSDLRNLGTPGTTYQPKMAEKDRQALIQGWRGAVDRTR
jgi:glycerol kinase